MTKNVLLCGVGGQGTVLASRLIALAAMEKGMEARGVELYTQKIIWELQNAMRMSGCRTLKDITRDHIVITKQF